MAKLILALASWCAGSALRRPRESVPATPAPAVHDPDAKRRVRHCVAPLPARPRPVRPEATNSFLGVYNVPRHYQLQRSAETCNHRPPNEDPDRALIVGIWGRLVDEIMQCYAESWFLLTPPGSQSTCYKMLRCPVVSKVQRAMFSAQGNMNAEVTSKSRRALLACDFRYKCIPQKELRRYVPRSMLRPKTPFSTPFRGVLPPSGQQIRAPMRTGRPTL